VYLRYQILRKLRQGCRRQAHNGGLSYTSIRSLLHNVPLLLDYDQPLTLQELARSLDSAAILLGTSSRLELLQIADPCYARSLGPQEKGFWKGARTKPFSILEHPPCWHAACLADVFSVSTTISSQPTIPLEECSNVTFLPALGHGWKSVIPA